jgi:bifunctional DNA-binding transcriptional regulator/antitoxin component of YhaV-PrlF toxin-antitoxin module
METVLESDGKIKVPDEILKKLGVKVGDKMSITLEGESIILRKINIEEEVPPPPLHLLYRPEITHDPITGEKLDRNLELEARLMTIPVFNRLAKRGFFIMSEKNRLLAFGFRTVEEAIQHFLSKGTITLEDLKKAGIEWK